MYYTFPENLKTIRTAKRITQTELAKGAGLTQATISAYEAGTTYPRIDKVYDLARALNINIMELVR